MDEGGKVKAKFDEIFSGKMNDNHLLEISYSILVYFLKLKDTTLC